MDTYSEADLRRDLAVEHYGAGAPEDWEGSVRTSRASDGHASFLALLLEAGVETMACDHYGVHLLRPATTKDRRYKVRRWAALVFACGESVAADAALVVRLQGDVEELAAAMTVFRVGGGLAFLRHVGMARGRVGLH